MCAPYKKLEILWFYYQLTVTPKSNSKSKGQGDRLEIHQNLSVLLFFHNFKCANCVEVLPWWCNQMEIFSTLLAFCVGNSPVTGEFPTQRPVIYSFDVFFDLHLNEGWVNNREAGDLRCHHAHYDVTIMTPKCSNILAFKVILGPLYMVPYTHGTQILSSSNVWML